jgi:hypothetical protein
VPTNGARPFVSLGNVLSPRHAMSPVPLEQVRCAVHVRLRVLLVLAGVLAAAGSASALEPGKALIQYPHRAWQTADGLPQNSVLALAQTPDSYL